MVSHSRRKRLRNGDVRVATPERLFSVPENKSLKCPSRSDPQLTIWIGSSLRELKE